MPKRTLRTITKGKRDLLCRSDREGKALSIKEKLFEQPEFDAARAVLFYAAFGSEVPTLDMMKDALEIGKIVVLPITDIKTNSLVLKKVDDLGTLIENKYGIPEPSVEYTEDFNPDLIEMVLVPGMVFDIHGNRIGYGGGYYDRFLRQIDPSVPWVSVAFDLQVVPQIPSESHDLPVDKVITESQVIDCRDNRIERFRDILGY